MSIFEEYGAFNIMANNAFTNHMLRSATSDLGLKYLQTYLLSIYWLNFRGLFKGEEEQSDIGRTPFTNIYTVCLFNQYIWFLHIMTMVEYTNCMY